MHLFQNSLQIFLKIDSLSDFVLTVACMFTLVNLCASTHCSIHLETMFVVIHEIFCLKKIVVNVVLVLRTFEVC